MSGFRRLGAHSEPPVQGVELRRARARARSFVRPRWVLGTFAYLASVGLIAATLVEPTGFSTAASLSAADPRAITETQTVEVTAQGVELETRDAFVVTKPKPVVTAATAPAAGTPDPGTAKAIAFEMVAARGWGQGEYDCLVALWNKESHWNVYAHNKSSGAYGIPQALPGSKMASAGEDWATNPTTQITWGLGYIAGRYGTPCGAWGASQAKGWY